MAQCILICVGVVAIAIGPMRRRHVDGIRAGFSARLPGGICQGSDVSGRMIAVEGRRRGLGSSRH